MKKNYISPIIIVEVIEEESVLMFSKVKIGVIGEGDETPLGPGVEQEGTGEGLNAKHGFNFGWSDDLDDEWED